MFDLDSVVRFGYQMDDQEMLDVVTGIVIEEPVSGETEPLAVPSSAIPDMHVTPIPRTKIDINRPDFRPETEITIKLDERTLGLSLTVAEILHPDDRAKFSFGVKYSKVTVLDTFMTVKFLRFTPAGSQPQPDDLPMVSLYDGIELGRHEAQLRRCMREFGKKRILILLSCLFPKHFSSDDEC